MIDTYMKLSIGAEPSSREELCRNVVVVGAAAAAVVIAAE